MLFAKMDEIKGRDGAGQHGKAAALGGFLIGIDVVDGGARIGEGAIGDAGACGDLGPLDLDVRACEDFYTGRYADLQVRAGDPDVQGRDWVVAQGGDFFRDDVRMDLQRALAG